MGPQKSINVIQKELAVRWNVWFLHKILIVILMKNTQIINSTLIKQTKKKKVKMKMKKTTNKKKKRVEDPMIFI